MIVRFGPKLDGMKGSLRRFYLSGGKSPVLKRKHSFENRVGYGRIGREMA
jgi:hypothetical protein